MVSREDLEVDERSITELSTAPEASLVLMVGKTSWESSSGAGELFFRADATFNPTIPPSPPDEAQSPCVDLDHQASVEV
jgi:hypothetical protein